MSFDPHPIRDDARTQRRVAINHRRNKAQDHTVLLDEAASAFRYADHAQSWWNPEELSLLHGTPVWDGASEHQRRLLNQLFWVAYYSQIVSAEVATIFFNQTSAAGLYGLEDFRAICDMLDLESSQERAHIAAFKQVGDAVEEALFGRRVFTWPMRGPYAQTMIFPDSGRLRDAWKSLQLRTFGLLSSGNAFIASQYFTVRGLRTLNGKMVQQQLGALTAKARDKGSTPLPSQISWFHFQDESFHFNSSTILGKEVVKSLRPPTGFERMVANLGISGCQRDHRNVSVVCRGLFWHEPATFQAVFSVLTSPHFGLDRAGAIDLMTKTFCEENAGVDAAFVLHRKAVESYRSYLADLDHVSEANRSLSIMASSTQGQYLARNRRALARFVPDA